MKSHAQLYDFMNSYKLGVISTVSEAKLPNSAIVGFGQTGETSETIQIEGIARELTPEELDIVRQNYWQKNPHAEVHHKNPGERYFIITPTWIRYTDLSVEPWDIAELRF